MHDLDEEELLAKMDLYEKRLAHNFDDIFVPQLHLHGLGAQNLFFQAVYIHPQITKSISAVNKLAVDVFEREGNGCGYEGDYMPHLSMVYGDLDPVAKAKVMEGLAPQVIGKAFNFGSLQLWKTEGLHTEWKCIRTVALPLPYLNKTLPRSAIASIGAGRRLYRSSSTEFRDFNNKILQDNSMTRIDIMQWATARKALIAAHMAGMKQLRGSKGYEEECAGLAAAKVIEKETKENYEEKQKQKQKEKEGKEMEEGEEEEDKDKEGEKEESLNPLLPPSPPRAATSASTNSTLTRTESWNLGEGEVRKKSGRADERTRGAASVSQSFSLFCPSFFFSFPVCFPLVSLFPISLLAPFLISHRSSFLLLFWNFLTPSPPLPSQDVSSDSSSIESFSSSSSDSPSHDETDDFAVNNEVVGIEIERRASALKRWQTVRRFSSVRQISMKSAVIMHGRVLKPLRMRTKTSDILNVIEQKVKECVLLGGDDPKQAHPILDIIAGYDFEKGIAAAGMSWGVIGHAVKHHRTGRHKRRSSTGMIGRNGWAVEEDEVCAVAEADKAAVALKAAEK